MGQYWIPANLDKREFINPHKLGCGLKLCEMLGTSPGVGTALIVLTAAMPTRRGGGDLHLPAPGAYGKIAKRTIGRWAGDRIAIVGDYAEAGDLAREHQAEKIHRRCQSLSNYSKEELEEMDADEPSWREWLFKDITDDVCAVIEHELGGRWTGPGWSWRKWEPND